MHQRKMSKMTKYLPYSMYLKEYMTLKRDVFFNLVTSVQQGKILGQLGSSTSTYQLTCFFTLTSTNKFSQLANRDKYGRKIRDLHYWSDFGTSRNIKCLFIPNSMRKSCDYIFIIYMTKYEIAYQHYAKARCLHQVQK